ncbi:MAG: hypothetical protein FWF96_00855 [Kiritimatiellaeota bacterium]|nr:hypothetical protein [Kiritimatiellota bacterium]
MKKWMTSLALATLAASAPRGMAAEENPAPNALMGAEALIREIQGGGEGASAFSAAAAKFQRESGAMTPEAAAEGWLKLAGMFAETKPSIGSHYFYDDERNTFLQLAGALPGPAAWPLIRAGLDTPQEGEDSARRFLPRILMTWLARDFEAAKSLAQELEKQGKLRGDDALREVKAILSGAQVKRKTDISDIVEKLMEPDKYYGAVRLPDIAEQYDLEKAEGALRKFFAASHELEEVEGAETLALAQRVALDMRDALKTAQWILVDDSDAGRELYALFMERFPPFERRFNLDNEGAAKSFTRLHGAVERLVVAALKDGRMDDALEIARPYVAYASGLRHDEEDYNWHFTRAASRLPAQLRFDFHLRLHGLFPGLPVDSILVGTALACGREDAVEAMLLERMGEADISPARLRVLRHARVKLLLAADRVADAVALRAEILAEAGGSKKALEKLPGGGGVGYALLTAELAALDGDADAQNAALDAAVKLWDKDGGNTYQLGDIITALENAGRTHEVEPLAVAWVAKQEEYDWHRQNTLERLARTLLNFYARQNRAGDIMALLDDAPWWEDACDVKAFAGNYSYEKGVNAAIANALFESGHADAAQKFLAALMLRDHSRDWMYELKLKMAGDGLEGFIAEMDALYARDAFEERPLIWKAEALRRAGRLDEAEACARHAIKVDPTDGESPAGDRVRSYAVLADILAERGKADDAQFFRDVVKSVRVAEEGDKLKDLGLTRRGMERYAEAEALFADAYCVQWRLAEQLRDMGRHEEARKHYEIAFERMPEQFGQVASLCFGCMGVFDSPESVSAAEVVLARLVETPPVRPAALYLMGQLRGEQKRYDEAFDWYAKALEADPDYMDVLKKILGLRRHVARDGVDWAVFQNSVFRLDPLGRHHSYNDDDVLDWPVFWELRDAAAKALPAPPESVYPLAANIARLDAENTRGTRTWVSSNHADKTAAEVLANTRLVRHPAELNGTLSRDNTPTRRRRGLLDLFL